MTEVILHADGSVTRPGPGFTVNGLADEWVRDNTVAAVFDIDGNEVAPAVVPARPEVLTEEDLLVHPIHVAKMAAAAAAALAAASRPILQDVINALEGEVPGRAATIQAKADARVAAS